jgi:GntR family trehalose operon transcriptional repressor
MRSPARTADRRRRCSRRTHKPKEIAEKSVYEYLENVVGDTIVTTRRTLTVEKITEIDEKYLDLMDCGAMAVVTSETNNAAGEMFEYTQSRHRPDMFAFYSVARRRK